MHLYAVFHSMHLVLTCLIHQADVTLDRTHLDVFIRPSAGNEASEECSRINTLSSYRVERSEGGGGEDRCSSGISSLCVCLCVCVCVCVRLCVCVCV